MPLKARPEVAQEEEPGVPDNRLGGDMAPSVDEDPLKPERKGPEMPRLFLDLGPPQGNSEQIKGEEVGKESWVGWIGEDLPRDHWALGLGCA